MRRAQGRRKLQITRGLDQGIGGLVPEIVCGYAPACCCHDCSDIAGLQPAHVAEIGRMLFATGAQLAAFTESVVEQCALAWLEAIGRRTTHGPDLLAATLRDCGEVVMLVCAGSCTEVSARVLGENG